MKSKEKNTGNKKRHTVTCADDILLIIKKTKIIMIEMFVDVNTEERGMGLKINERRIK